MPSQYMTVILKIKYYACFDTFPYRVPFESDYKNLNFEVQFIYRLVHFLELEYLAKYKKCIEIKEQKLPLFPTFQLRLNPLMNLPS